VEVGLYLGEGLGQNIIFNKGSLLHHLKLLLIGAVTFLAFHFSTAQTLEALYSSARSNTALIQERALAVEISFEEQTQAVSTALPSITAESNNVWREVADVGPFGEGYQHSALINLSQPLFQGGAVWQQMAIARNRPKVAELEKKQEELQLYSLLADSFFRAYQNQNEIRILTEQETTLKNRLKRLNERARIGRSKQTDVLAARSQLARIVADRTGLEGMFLQAKRTLKNLSGVTKISQLVDSRPAEDLRINPQWEKQIDDNPQIQAQKLLLENTERERKASQGSYLPQVDANANYYLDRAGILRDSSWDVTLVARWNLYNGGNDSADVRIRRLQMKQVEVRLKDLQRTIKNDFSLLKEEFVLQKKSLLQLKQAIRLARENYQSHLQEVNRGLVSELEALRVLEEYLQIQRSYEQQVYRTKWVHAQLRTLAGDLP
jgi:outer membrane protein TolC